jgi:hypothetical protein
LREFTLENEMLITDVALVVNTYLSPISSAPGDSSSRGPMLAASLAGAASDGQEGVVAGI